MILPCAKMICMGALSLFFNIISTTRLRRHLGQRHLDGSDSINFGACRSITHAPMVNDLMESQLHHANQDIRLSGMSHVLTH